MYRHILSDWLARLPWRQQVLALISAQGIRAYLVGGTVRDALLDRESCDLDITVEAPALALARQLANRLRGAYVPLDVERDVGRIVVRVAGGQQHVDIAALRAGSIEADLWARDYTVNAMAVPIGTEMGALLDPTGGQGDLAARVLRVVRADSFADDPLRILRGVRLRGALGFALTPQTEDLARRWLPALWQVSPERVRDELVQVLALRHAAETLAYAGTLGVYDVVLPELGRDIWVRGIQIVADLETLFDHWHLPALPSAGDDRKVPSPLPARDELLEEALGPYLAPLADHWTEELSYGRNRWLALKLAALLLAAPAAPDALAEAVRRLHFSAREVDCVAATLGSCARVCAWGAGGEPGALTLYRYFRSFGADGVDGAILALAGRCAQAGADACTWSGLLRRVAQVLYAWFIAYGELVDPPQLIGGREVIHALRLTPGPLVGQLLELVREAQVQGLVHTRQEALAYLRAHPPGGEAPAKLA